MSSHFNEASNASSLQKHRYDTLGKLYPTVLGANLDKDYKVLFGTRRQATNMPARAGTAVYSKYSA